ncbi:hypothetical protein RJ640_018676 [Escallonia rubra]|uniref:PUM-HD domain-containing protein n=1 Tax=Escallonia rubra TaxID=112253 RepID=A0AA88R3I6_9ASTE|nr:hypothetical protein RJ640_018676 [Escallonia rubra]
MERGEDDGFDWTMLNPNLGNYSSSSSDNTIRNYLATYQPSNGYALPAENYRFQISQPEMVNPLYLSSDAVPLNPSFPDTVCDGFSRLNLSTPSHQSRFVAPPPSLCSDAVGAGAFLRGYPLNNIGSSVDMGFAPATLDLQRLRVQSAVGGQMGLYMQQQQQRLDFDMATQNQNGVMATQNRNSVMATQNRNSVMATQNQNGVPDYGFVCNMYNGGERSLFPAINSRVPTKIRAPANPNGFRLSYDFVDEVPPNNSNRNGYCTLRNSPSRSRGISCSINETQSENPSIWISSLYDKDNNLSMRSKQRRPSFATLEDLEGKMFVWAKDQYGHLVLQKKVEEGKPEEIELIFSELKDHIGELMVDKFGNLLIQKFFELCNEEQMTQILISVTRDARILKNICHDTHGTRAMQKLIEHLTTQNQRSLVAAVLSGITVDLTKSTQGHHVIEHCLKSFSDESTSVLISAVHGIFRNYVVQYLLGMKVPRVTADILEQLAGSYVSLAKNKYGSNVVERCLKECSDDQITKIIEELIRSSENFLTVVQDPYGNYVVQSALLISKGSDQHQKMVNLLQQLYPFIHSHPHGKRLNIGIALLGIYIRLDILSRLMFHRGVFDMMTNYVIIELMA